MFDLSNIKTARRVHGGYESTAARVVTPSGPCFVKWGQHDYAKEARALSLIADTGTLRVPRVIEVGEGYLVLEWLAPPKGDRVIHQSAEALGRQLAKLHQAPTSGYARDPLEDDPPVDDWVACYRDRYFAPDVARAEALGRMPPDRRARLDRLMERLPDLLGGVDRRPSLCHGDFHRGNVLAAPDGELVLIDPHLYVADREVELAYTEAFPSGFPPRFYAAYEEMYPSAPGRAERRDVYLMWLMLRRLCRGDLRAGEKLDAILRWRMHA